MKIDKEFASLIPPLTDDEYKRLEESILFEGCRDAIVLWGDIIIDGHNRYKICTANNIDYQTMQKDFASRDDVKLWMLQNQLSRRNLNDFQRIEMVRKCEEAIKAQAKERQLSGLTQNENTVREIFPERENEGKRATEELGELAGVSRKTYEHATAILDKAPEPVIEATRKKELSINAAYEVTKLPEEQQSEISERIKQGEPAKTAISEVKARKKKSVQETLNKTSGADIPMTEKINGEAIEISTTGKKYKIIYAAPTWKDTQSANELYKLPVKQVADDDSVLLLWVNAAKIMKALKTIKEWGFKYKTIVYVWIKTQTDDINSYTETDSDWTQETCELCLLATKGNLKRVNGEIKQVLMLPVETDGKKPSRFRELVVQLLGDLPALELFAEENFTFNYNGIEVKWDIAKM